MIQTSQRIIIIRIAKVGKKKKSYGAEEMIQASLIATTEIHGTKATRIQVLANGNRDETLLWPPMQKTTHQTTVRPTPQVITVKIGLDPRRRRLGIITTMNPKTASRRTRTPNIVFQSHHREDFNLGPRFRVKMTRVRKNWLVTIWDNQSDLNAKLIPSQLLERNPGLRGGLKLPKFKNFKKMTWTNRRTPWKR